MSNISNTNPSGPPSKKFRLDRQNAKLMGVCSGLANYFNIDANVIRLGFVASVLLGFGLPVLMYLAIGLIAD